jgi:predicted HicB family RNase H-like nuclease
MCSDTEARLKSLTVKIPEKLHKALKVQAAEQGRSMAEVIERLIKAYLQSTDPERIFKLDLK